jgi:transposase-like protein
MSAWQHDQQQEYTLTSLPTCPTNWDQLNLDGIVLKRSWAGEVRNVSLLVAISVNEEGYREILGIVEGAKESSVKYPLLRV